MNSTNIANYQMIFYLPIYFQSIHGMSAIKSGVNMLPFLAFFALGAVVSGGVIGKTRYLQPYELISGLLSTAGMALFYTLEVDSSKARYIGPQVLFGFGLGFGNQIPMTAVQGLSKPEDMANSSGIVLSKSLITIYVFHKCTSPTNFRSSDAGSQWYLRHPNSTIHICQPHAPYTGNHLPQHQRWPGH